MKSNKRPILCGVLSGILMGSGQLLNRQFLKGILYLATHILLILWVYPYIYWGVEGLVTLGVTPKQDHSLFLMVYGVLSLIALVYLILFQVSCIKDAYRNAVKRQNHEILPNFREGFRDSLRRKSPLFFAAPGIIAVSFIVVLPLVFSIMLGFTNYDLYHQPPGKLLDWVGFKNFVDLFTIRSWSYTLTSILLWTVEFTILTSVLPYMVGILIAVLLNNPRVRFQKAIKVGFILPWAIPSYISIQVWRGMFDTNDGFINHILQDLFHLQGVGWFQNTTSARAALVIVAVWCGFTFPMMISDSIMKSIPSELYEAARLDGAAPHHCFFKITLPLLLFSIAPLFIMGLSGAFNNFNLIYLLTQGYPPNLDFVGAGNTDILISWLFNMTFTTMKYNYASAISLLIFIFLAAFSIFNLRRTKNFTEEDIMQ